MPTPSPGRRYWSDDPGADEALLGDEEHLVRPYSITRGRKSPKLYDVVALVHISPNAVTPPGLHPEPQAILDMCRRSLCSVAEISAHLGQPLSVVRLLLYELETAKLVEILQPQEPAGVGIELLEQLLQGLRNL